MGNTYLEGCLKNKSMRARLLKECHKSLCLFWCQNKLLQIQKNTSSSFNFCPILILRLFLFLYNYGPSPASFLFIFGFLNQHLTGKNCSFVLDLNSGYHGWCQIFNHISDNWRSQNDSENKWNYQLLSKTVTTYVKQSSC